LYKYSITPFAIQNAFLKVEKSHNFELFNADYDEKTGQIATFQSVIFPFLLLLHKNTKFRLLISSYSIIFVEFVFTSF